MARKKTTTPAASSLTLSWAIDRSSLVVALKLAGTVVKGSGKIPYLEHVLLRGEGGVLTLSATNADETVIATVDAELVGDHTYCLPYKLLSRIVLADPQDSLTVGMVDGQPLSASIRGDGTYSVSGLDPANYPTLPSRSTVKDWGSLPLAELSGALDRGRHSAGGGKLDLNAALVRADGDDLVVYATDSLRLWRERLVDCGATMPDGDSELSIGLSTFAPIAAMDGAFVRVGWSDQRQHLVFLSEDDRVMLAFRRPEAKHPAYEQVVKVVVKEDFTYSVNRYALESAVRRAQTTARGDRVQIVHGAGGLTVQSESQEGATTVLIPDDSEAGGEVREWRAQFNGDFLLEALEAVGHDTVKLLLSDESDRLSMTVVAYDGVTADPLRMSVIMRQEWGK